MILDMYSSALQKDLAAITWLPTVILILKILFYIMVVYIIIKYFAAVIRIKKEIIKIRQLLENNKNDVI